MRLDESKIEREREREKLRARARERERERYIYKQAKMDTQSPGHVFLLTLFIDRFRDKHT